MKKRITLLITGSIAVVKIEKLCELLIQTGKYELQAVVSEHAQQLFEWQKLETILGKHHVYIDFFDESTGVTHIDLAQHTDAVIVLPASYSIVGKMANGIADDLVSTVLAAVKQPVLFVPAMNTNMYENPIFQTNKARLESYGHIFMTPAVGMLKCGVEGIGRLPELTRIVERIDIFLDERPLSRKKVLITAGPTRVYIDPIRYITNTASGKLGYELAKKAQQLGAEVTLVLGPSILPDLPGVKIVRVETPDQMYTACDTVFAYSDIVIMNAAVSDYKPTTTADKKIKKSGDTLTLTLERSIDILATLGKKKVDQVLIGFAAESENHIEYARGKLIRKNADIIVANDLSNFNTDEHEAIIITHDTERPLPKVPKEKFAHILWDALLTIVD